MSKPNVRRYAIEKHNREKEPIISNNYGSNLFYLSKHLKKVYPIELHKTCSHTLINDSSQLDKKKREIPASNIVVSPNEKELMRCSWITNSTGKFHMICTIFAIRLIQIRIEKFSFGR